MQELNLLIDIGNTNTKVALATDKKIVKRYFIHTSKKDISRKAMKRLIGKSRLRVKKAIIVSVVPSFLKEMKSTVKAVLPKAHVMVVGKNIKVPIKNRYKKPRQVGQDRLVTAFAAARLFGAPILSIDFGSAVTFDYVNRKGEYEGGLIFPGLRIALSSLVESAALLPRVDIKLTRGLLGRDTRSSVNNGMLYGYAATCDGLIEKFRKKYHPSLEAVATGGDAALVAKYSRHMGPVCSDLILSGLQLLLTKEERA